MNLGKLLLGHSPLTNKIYLYNPRKDGSAKEKKELDFATLLYPLAQQQVREHPNGVSHKIHLGDGLWVNVTFEKALE